MSKNHIFRLFIALVAALGLAPAFAATVSLIPLATTVAVNELFTIDLFMNADDANGTHPGNYSGEVIIDFDPALLTFVGFSEAMVSTTGTPVIDTTGVKTTVKLGFGTVSFGSSPDEGVIGTYTFRANSTTGAATVGVADGFPLNSFINGADEFFPSFVPTSVTIVPVPAAVWLMLSGLGLLGFASRAS